MKPGMIVVAKLTGTVEATNPQKKETRSLKRSDLISEAETVKVGAASNVTLAFSNGAVINLLENTTLVITEFLQDPFSSSFSAEASEQEPSTSVTKLQLVSGEMVATVKKLRTEQGSSLTVNTPVGAAGVRGTTFSISYQPPKDGKGTGTFTLNVTEGSMRMVDAFGVSTVVNAGKSLVISAQAVGNLLRNLLFRKLSDLSQDEIKRIVRIATDGRIAARFIFNNVLDRQIINFFNRRDGHPVVISIPEDVTEVNPRAGGRGNNGR